MVARVVFETCHGKIARARECNSSRTETARTRGSIELDGPGLLKRYGIWRVRSVRYTVGKKR